MVLACSLQIDIAFTGEEFEVISLEPQQTLAARSKVMLSSCALALFGSLAVLLALWSPIGQHRCLLPATRGEASPQRGT